MLVAAGGKVEPRPEAQRALVTLSTPTASEADVLDAMQWMVGSPENASRGVAAVQELSRASGCRLPDGRRAVHPSPGLVGTARRRPVLGGSRVERRSRAGGERASPEAGARPTCDHRRHPERRPPPATGSTRTSRQGRHRVRSPIVAADTGWTIEGSMDSLRIW